MPAGEAGTLSALTVDLDITHTWRGDLEVTLISPLGTEVVLHNRGGSSADDLLGNYPGTLEVAGPGDLADFIGEGQRRRLDPGGQRQRELRHRHAQFVGPALHDPG